MHTWLLYIGSSKQANYKSLIDHVGISEQMMKAECSSEKLRRIAVLIPNWNKMATNLELRDQDIIDIDSDRLLTDFTMKSLKVLERWHRTNGFMASYKKLVEACIRNQDLHLAGEVCKVIKGTK